jgi:hypothetical protein
VTGRRLERRSINAGLALFCLFAFLFLLLPCVLRDKLAPGPTQSLAWTYWMQLAAGNWSPVTTLPGDPSTPHLSRWTFAFSAILAVFLNNSLIFAVIALVWRQFTTRRTAMKLIQAFVERDEINKTAVINAFKVNGEVDKEIMDKIDLAFIHGASMWKQQVTEVFGEEEAGRLMDLLGRTI